MSSSQLESMSGFLRRDAASRSCFSCHSSMAHLSVSLLVTLGYSGMAYGISRPASRYKADGARPVSTPRANSLWIFSTDFGTPGSSLSNVKPLSLAWLLTLSRQNPHSLVLRRSVAAPAPPVPEQPAERLDHGHGHDFVQVCAMREAMGLEAHGLRVAGWRHVAMRPCGLRPREQGDDCGQYSACVSPAFSRVCPPAG